MGIVNVTPDSFSDGGAHGDAAGAVAHGVALWGEGADLLDVGGESTRPGAAPVAVADEIARVVPVIEGLRRACPDAVISVDTRRTAVARAALAAGAAIVNDVAAARDEGMAGLVASQGAGLVLMHMRGEPGTMQHDTRYDDLIGEVSAFLRERLAAVEAAGVARSRVVLDAGLGFGKSMADNPTLISSTSAFATIGCPVLVGASRKRFIGALCGVERPRDRVAGSLGAACAAAQAGARILRVHDVAATIQALRVFLACSGG